MSAASPAGRFALVVVPIAGVAALVAGILVLRSSPLSFGWFAYAPLTDATFVPGPASPFWLGPALVGLGIALLAGWTGFLLGRRRRG